MSGQKFRGHDLKTVQQAEKNSHFGEDFGAITEAAYVFRGDQA